MYDYEPVPEGAPSNTSSLCGLALILTVNYLFHCMAFFTDSEEALKFKEELK